MRVRQCLLACAIFCTQLNHSQSGILPFCADDGDFPDNENYPANGEIVGEATPPQCECNSGFDPLSFLSRL